MSIQRTGRVGVAISTTGDEHRMRFLETCVRHWDKALRPGDSLFVTVDGDEEACERVRKAVFDTTGSVYRVGQPTEPQPDQFFDGHLGVAVNKNTGLELLIDQTHAEHLFLSDDDTWPLYEQSLGKHIDLTHLGKHLPHSMVCWGKSRLIMTDPPLAMWTWPRGVMMYTHHDVVWQIGGMDECFGPGGHEHVEWSQRIHNAGFTPAPFCSPASYAHPGPSGNAMRASVLWHAEDMRRPGEPLGEHQQRKQALTSIRRAERDWDKINQVMASHEGDAGYVPFRAHQNARGSATLCSEMGENLTCAVEPAEPRSEK